jgi:predicted nuclease of predicted toxin-antitoxin system
VRFKVDQNLPVEIADALRDAGHDAHTVYEEELAGTPDPQLSVILRSEGRGLVTLDLGFGDIRNYPPRDYQGIVILRPSSQDKPAVLRLFSAVVPMLEREPIVGRLWIVDDQRIRMRG